MAVTFCFSGLLVAESLIPDYFIWLYWITPYSWLLRLLCVSEFASFGSNGEYDELVSVPSQTYKRVGDLFLESFSIKTDQVWIAYGFLYLFCGLVVSFSAYTYGMHYNCFGNSKPMVSGTARREPLASRFTRPRRSPRLNVFSLVDS